MTSYVPFVPSSISAPTFNATLDGEVCTVVVTWNVASKRYFVNIYDAAGTLIVCRGLTETPAGQDVLSLVYDPGPGVCVATLRNAIWRPIGQVVSYYLDGFDPTWLNGWIRALSIAPGVFSFPVGADPGVVVTLGSASRFANLAATYFQNSSLIFRNSQFEIRP